MDPKEILALMETGFATVGSKLDAQLAELNETAKKVLVTPATVIKTPEQLATEAATLEEKTKAEAKGKLEQAAVARNITSFEVWDIPVGQALVGGFTAVFASELIDGFLIKQGDIFKGVVKLAGAGVAVKWGGRVLGSTGSKALAILLAYDGIRSLIPIDTWAKKGATTVTGMMPAGGLGGFKKNAREEPAPGNGHKADYYEALKGGAR